MTCVNFAAKLQEQRAPSLENPMSDYSRATT